MISNARGKHSSPGVYIEEIDKTYATKSLGITTLGLVGETLKGPAFEPIRISDWNEFQDYFGGTSTEKFKGNGYPKYELPYIAKSYLQESKNLDVCRILGLSGYDAGKAWVIYDQKGTNAEKYPVAILREKAEYNINNEGDTCNPVELDSLISNVKQVSLTGYTSIDSVFAGCSNSTTAITNTVSEKNYGKFKLIIEKKDGSKNEEIAISFNPSDKNYIVNVLGMNPHDGDYSLFVEDLYDLAHIKFCKDKKSGIDMNIAGVDSLKNYKSQFRSAQSPWFVSEIKGDGINVELKKLFRFHTVSDGNAANSQVKISIANILPDEGLFDVLVRDFNDTDSAPIILERFNKCNMVPGSQNYIGLRIGTINGDYELKSKYIIADVIENDMTETCVPCGFLGYPMRNISGFTPIQIDYNLKVIDSIKPNKQFFGMSSNLVGVDVDMLTYKGVDAYTEEQLPSQGYTKGFHLDSMLYSKVTVNSKEEKVVFTVDGKSGYEFDTPSESEGSKLGATTMPHISSEKDMVTNIYCDKRFRKFTCYMYGGFDGWDIYRKERTNTSEYKSNVYKGLLNKIKKDSQGNEYIDSTYAFTDMFDGSVFGLEGKYNNSDYYAYLAGYKQFDNPSKFKINILATPGIDYVNNIDLVNDVLDIVEESRQGDCIYIVTTPEKTVDGGEIDAIDAVEKLNESELNTSYAATYYPWVKYYDEKNKKYINLPVTKDVVRNFAYTDNVSHPWFASAGMSRGNVDCVKATHFTKLEEEDVLYEGLINPVKSFGSDGVKIWGNKTMYHEDTPLNRINVRRLMIRIKDLVMSAAKQLIFEQNDNTIESQFRSIVDPILANAKQNRGISDYKIKTDTSAEARDRKELPAAIYVKPINCLEYIPITFTIYPEGAKFDE